MAKPLKTKSRWQLGTLAPVVLILVAAADVALRFLPMDFVSFRAWEAMEFNRVEGVPFQASKVYHGSRCFGDLANMGNLPAQRHYRAETFTSDRYGFRNPPEMADGPAPEVLLMGTSYSVGAGVNDDETLSAQLGRLAQCRVYNAAGSLVKTPEEIRSLAQRLHMKSGIVIYEFLEGHFVYPEFQDFLKKQYPWLVRPPPPEAPKPVIDRVLLRVGGTNLLATWQPLSISRLQIVSQQLYRKLENDRFLPNPKRADILVKKLSNGEEMLFEPWEAVMDQQPRDPSWAAPYWSWLAQELRKDNLALLVLLVPQKYTIYKPLLQEPAPPAVEPTGYLERIEAELRKAGVPVVNLTAPISAEARARLAHGETIYFPDDSHWNAAGISIAAQVITNVFAKPAPAGATPAAHP